MHISLITKSYIFIKDTHLSGIGDWKVLLYVSGMNLYIYLTFFLIALSDLISVYIFILYTDKMCFCVSFFFFFSNSGNL